MSFIDTDLIKLSSRVEWPPLLHNLAMLHATIRLRSRFNRAGWNHPETMDFGYNEISVRAKYFYPAQKRRGKNTIFHFIVLKITLMCA